jgi:protein-tyrosine phosphatase
MKILFVCTANVCRSPMAKAMLDALAADRGLTFETESAGVGARDGRDMDANTRAVLQELGLPAGDHRSKRVSEAQLREADLVLVMSPRQLAELRRLFGELPQNIHVLPEYASGVSAGGIPDPHGYTMPAYRATARQLLEHVRRLLDRLQRESTR